MANRNYIKGANAERKTLKWFRDRNFWGARVAGSKGPADLVILSPDKGYLVQVKSGSGRMSKEEQNVLRLAAKKAGCVPLVVSWKRGEKIPVVISLDPKNPLLHEQQLRAGWEEPKSHLYLVPDESA